MNKIVKVIDENGNTYSSTYVKRAKGLVKHNRAYWVDDSVICLRMPSEKLEVKIMNIKDIDRMIALVQANNWAITNSKNPNVYGSAKVLAENYNEIVKELQESNVILPKSLEEIDYKVYENKSSNEVSELVQIIYSKDCLIYPLLKIEKDEILKKTDNIENNMRNFAHQKDSLKNQTAIFKKNISDRVRNLTENLNSDVFNRVVGEIDNIVDGTNDYIGKFDKNINDKVKNLTENLNSDVFSRLTDEIDNIIDSTNDYMDKFKDEIEDLVDELSDLEFEIEDLENENEDNEDEINNFKQKIEDKKSEIFEKLKKFSNLFNQN